MKKKEQIFKSVFGSTWDQLPPVFHKRYMNRPDSDDITTVEGKMDISFSKLMSCFIPIFRLFRVLVPYQGKNIPVLVDFQSKMNSDLVYLNRKFYFPGKKPYEFNSCVQVIKENEVVERMAFGLGWVMVYFYNGNKVVMQHRKYVWRIFGLNIPLPLEIFLGKSYAEEEMIDDNAYRITMMITHPLFGTMYSYSGNFNFKRLAT